jgi:heat-inducible transcriptional repressor
LDGVLDDRKSVILQALVEEYIRTGEPVSSRAVLEASGLHVSSATVRHELARLEQDGFVAQPHTSAGRIPTEAAFRYFVDHCAPVRLRRATHHRIEEFFSGVQQELSRMLKETSKLLADLTQFPAVVVGPGIASDAVRGLHAVQVSPQAMLVVVVAESGRVVQELARIPEVVTSVEIARAEEALQEALVGRSLPEGLPDVGRYAPEARHAGVVFEAGLNAIRRVESSTRDLYVGGTSQLAGLWEDLSKVHRLLAFLERESDLLDMLAVAEIGTSVRIGRELPFRDDDVALVATSYETGDHGVGRIGVLGPTRMNYRRTIKVVEEVGEGLAESLGG